MKRIYRILYALSALLTGLGAPQAQALHGVWRGELAIGQARLPLVFNFSETADGAVQCTLDSPAQGARGIAATVDFCSADSIAVSCGSIGASYTGRVTVTSIRGTFSQRGYSMPLDLTPEEPLEVRRPQTPRAPFGYSVREKIFMAPDGAILSGTLTMPEGADGAKVPVVVMVTGSGPQNRDEELLDHRPFAVIADHLGRHGIGSFRYDDRGTGKSSGNFATATTSTLAGDARSALAFVRTMAGVGKAGMLGHSEGGTIAFMLGASDAPDFIVSLAGMAVSGKETILAQNSHALDVAGVSGPAKDNTLRLLSALFDTIAAQHRAGISRPVDIDSLAAATGAEADAQTVASLKAAQRTRTPWLDAALCLDPSECMAKVKCPVLAVNGEKDTQIDAAANLAAIRLHMPQAVVRSMPGLNHLMQHAVSGEVSEYGEIRETIAPEVLDAITTFIKSL